MTRPRLSIGCVLAMVLLSHAASYAGSVAVAAPGGGAGDDAMPGVLRADSAHEVPAGVSLSLTSSYGFTGKTLEASDSHHRAAGRVAIAYALSADLAVALRMDGRYDKHFLEAERDDGWVGDPRLIGRFRHTLGPTLSAGIQVGLWAPGSGAPSLELDALSAEAVVALTWAPRDLPMELSANAGYRLDRSAASVSQPELLSLSDRMSLGLSDYNAVLAAAGASYEIGRVEALAELSLDLLHGSGAPGFRSSPMRVAIGARHQLSNGWSLFGTAEFRISKVLTEDVSETLLPFDPRVNVRAGLQLRFGQDESARAIITVDPPPVEATPEAITTGPLGGRITSGGTPVVGANLVLVDAGGTEHTATTGEDGGFSLEDLALGDATLKATAKGYEDGESVITISLEGSTTELKLESTLPPGQLRGQVRSFRGQGLSGKLTVEPGGKSIETDAAGGFELDLPPGDYEVTISVARFKAQTRKIRIDENGVTIMNVELRKRDQSRGHGR
ncbi:MAG: carboxypeptidase regulatory-like domain-containing protein [Myxococcales bacterium]|nr:carboxypeptidase regulatory-like domain-containing protein [Myxococcales bacterium]